MKNFRIAGRVIDRKTRAGLPGLLVQAVGRGVKPEVLLAKVKSDGGGAFLFEIPELAVGRASARRLAAENDFADDASAPRSGGLGLCDHGQPWRGCGSSHFRHVNNFT